jgi:hypothetical protein
LLCGEAEALHAAAVGLAFACGFRRQPEPAKRMKDLCSLFGPLSTSAKQSSAQKKSAT